jgi:putative nucleotidyltransferase with HDIG domain
LVARYDGWRGYIQMDFAFLDEQEVRYQVSRIKELPPLPQSLKRLVEILYEEVETSDELESIILYDQSLTAKVMNIANSTYYGSRGKVRSISRAIVVIGYDQVKSICLCMLLMQLLSGDTLRSSEREKLWKHSFATSKIAARMTAKRPWLSSEEAAVLGLLHDLGRLAMAVYFKDRYKSIDDLATARKVPHWCVEAQFGLTHTQLGKYLAVRWAFPKLFENVIEFHHAPDGSASFRAETRLIYLANVLSNAQEYPELLTDEATLSYCRDLNISEDEWQEHQDGLERLWGDVDQLWNLLR